MNPRILTIVLLLPLNLTLLTWESVGQGTTAAPVRARADKLDALPRTGHGGRRSLRQA
jgi:hypothetical protein